MKKLMLMMSCLCLGLMACKPAEQEVVEKTPAALAATQPDCSLNFGIDAWEPYQYMTVDNKPAGLDIEIVKGVLSNMGCQFTVTQGSWTELLLKLKAGEVDAVLGASKTEDRESFAYFSDAYRKERFQLYVRNSNINYPYKNITAYLEAGHKLGIVNQYYYGDDFAALYDNKTFQPLFIGAIISELNIARLLDEEIDGLLEDSFVAASILRRKGLDKYIKPHNISLESADVFIMFSQESISPQQVEAFNTGLTQLKENGDYNKIVNKYSH
ncbi:transporter substrate-binding domain-containing protein [Rheinheimera sp. MMS21-TC3]|uniref:transporter substrate-binding domain-containing protein n=1 Tax=Rheinheimera sp. MMS21-TC3 TaxID=3072790 RepID=UPI0028C42009|nr:transporter substrate-binding domain-containing protein [Rheinheimera sp. MMS21-TC3]WNO61854.1 transporter substrate-binding domain-containing protein [Rheinheimera sp. MMS21-TC3]